MGLSWASIVMFLFFLWYGLSEFVPALKSDTFVKIGAVLAILIALLILVKM